MLRECEGGEPRAESLSDTDSFFQVILEPRSDTQSRKTLEQDAKEYRSSKREGCPPELINRSYIRKV
ncbi:MAG: hypothetical protein EP298_01745 [Gammaproteobacteria bacterium]|nr:MAG: hypothetical protein EP298_01745 [Gammaproteobacteria bacterium]